MNVGESIKKWTFNLSYYDYASCFFISLSFVSMITTGIFAIPLVLENDIGAGKALKLSLSAVFSNIGGLILLMILGFLVVLLGLIAFCIGLFVAVPVYWAANVVAYRQVFPTLDKMYYSTPPPPTTYGSSFGEGL